jgi:hypothetical protein
MVPSGSSPSKSIIVDNVVPSLSVKVCRWARSHLANAALMASDSWANVCERAAAKIRPGRGQRSSPRPETSSTWMDIHVGGMAYLLSRDHR